MAQQEYKAEVKHKKTQKGGFLPAVLAPVAIAGLSAIAAKITSELYDFIKGKLISGGKYKIPHHKNKKEKIQFIKNIVHNL